jgi:hypothetical protein
MFYLHSEFNVTLIASDYDNLIRAMRTEKAEGHQRRSRRAQTDLLKFGISAGLAKKLIHSYRLSVLERLIKATEKHQPGEPGTYFLNGLKESRMKHGLQRAAIGDEDT